MPSLLLFRQPPPLTAGPPHQVPRPNRVARRFFIFCLPLYAGQYRSAKLSIGKTTLFSAGLPGSRKQPSSGDPHTSTQNTKNALIRRWDNSCKNGVRNLARIGLRGCFLVQAALRGEPGPNPGPAGPADRAGTAEFWVFVRVWVGGEGSFWVFMQMSATHRPRHASRPPWRPRCVEIDQHNVLEDSN